MTFFDKVTGNDIKKEHKAFDERVDKLPTEYKAVWKEIKIELWRYTDMTGRNLLPIFEDVVVLLEETSSDGLSVDDVFGGDIKGFCASIAKGENNSFRDKWRRQLNANVAKKLGK